MGKSNIEYVTHVWNPVQGCTPASTGCLNCWAKSQVERYGGAAAFVPQPYPLRLDEPVKRVAPARWLMASLGDLWHSEIPWWFVDEVLAVVGRTPQHRYMILTKRADLLYQYANSNTQRMDLITAPANICLGVSVENHQWAEERLHYLAEIAAAWRWVSYEPALGDVRWAELPNCIDLIVFGGEQGGKKVARPCDQQWAENAYEWCKEKEIAFWYKQGGDNVVDLQMVSTITGIKQLPTGMLLPNEKQGQPASEESTGDEPQAENTSGVESGETA